MLSILSLLSLLTTVSGESTVVVLSANRILEKDEPFFHLEDKAVNTLIENYKYSREALVEMRQDAVKYFNSQFTLNIKVDRSTKLKDKVFSGSLHQWVFTPFVFKPELNYHIVSHPNPACIGTNVLASGFLITNLVPTSLAEFGWLPMSSTVIYGEYLWEGGDGCERAIVPATSALPIVMNRLGYRAEEYFTTHPKYGKGLSHVTAINDKRTGRFEIWTTMSFTK